MRSVIENLVGWPIILLGVAAQLVAAAIFVMFAWLGVVGLSTVGSALQVGVVLLAIAVAVATATAVGPWPTPRPDRRVHVDWSVEDYEAGVKVQYDDVSETVDYDREDRN